VGSQVPPYNQPALIVLWYCPSLSSTLLGVDSLQALSFLSYMGLRAPIMLDSSKRMSPPLVPKRISVLKSHTNEGCLHQCGA
jgi:hypothetical protein